MEKTFMTKVRIVKVRHLNNIEIPLSEDERKHLILTGKNGSGKTSVLESIRKFLEEMASDDFELDQSKEQIAEWKDKLHARKSVKRMTAHQQIKNIEAMARRRWNDGCVVSMNSPEIMREKYKKGQFILAYYGDSRKIMIDKPTDYVKVDLKSVYSMEEHPAKDIGKFLLNLKTTQAFAMMKGDQKRVQDIDKWFLRFEEVLRLIYKEKDLKLVFDMDTHLFTIIVPKRDPFTLDCMSMGYAAIFDIVGDLMMRMENQHSYELEGIVLIDEIETHLHVQLQREIVPILIKLFPNIQFILTTHSPFIMSSTENYVVCDLEKAEPMPGWTDYPYDGIVSGYFDADLVRGNLLDMYDRYQKIVEGKVKLDWKEVSDLEWHLDKIPSFLSLDFGTAYEQLKLEARRRRLHDKK